MIFPRGYAASFLVALLFLFGGTVWCAHADKRSTAKTIPSGTYRFTITVQGFERSYFVHVPPSYDSAKKWPVVVMFHGGGGTAKGAMRETGWDDKSNKEGFLAVFPEGTPPDVSRPSRFRENSQTWNDGSRRSNVGAASREVPDINFVSAMLADLRVRFGVDERRIHITGFSNGASMTFRVARELSLVIAAAAPVAGADWLSGTNPERPVPILYLTGTDDPLNPVEGGEIHIGAKTFGTKASVREMIGNWVNMHSLRNDGQVVYHKDGATGIAYGLQGEAAKVILYTIEGHGHYWPGGKSALPQRLAGKNTAKLKATDVIWEFFKRHAKVDTIAANQTSQRTRAR